jgi:hypothetical protein
MAPVRPVAGGTRARHRLLALGLLPVLVALVPIAYTSPPDPPWPRGFYDAGDLDEVVETVVSASEVVTTVVLIWTEAANLTDGAVWWLQSEVLCVAAGSSGFTIRAPPSTARIAIA